VSDLKDPPPQVSLPSGKYDGYGQMGMVNLTGPSTPRSDPNGSQTIQISQKARVRYEYRHPQSPCSVRSPNGIPEWVINSGSEHVTLESCI